MASFMTKKKKYKFHVEICLEELLEVPFVSAVLFAKMRLLDGGSFQDHSSRQEVRDHKVLWGNSFSFPIKMMANATTGVMERCVLRISIRKESKGGRSFNKLGFVDLNLAEFAGAGLVHKKALLEGYDARHRQDNSMLKFKIELSMTSGDVLFKAPSPSLKHKQVTVENANNDPRSEDVSSGSLAGSIASGSSGFGSLPKKRPALLSSDLVIGQTLAETNVAVSVAPDLFDESPAPQHQPPAGDAEERAGEPPGHSRNSSNTSQLSKASGYSSVHSRSHSRQSSSGDSGHIRDPPSRTTRKRHPHHPTPLQNPPKKPNIPNTIPSSDTESAFATPLPSRTSTPLKRTPERDGNGSVYGTPRGLQIQTSLVSNSSNDEYKTPEGSFSNNDYCTIETRRNDIVDDRLSSVEMEKNKRNSEGVLRSKSDFQIPRTPLVPVERTFTEKFFSSDSLFSFLTPRPKRKTMVRDAEAAPRPLGAPLSPLPLPKKLPADVRATSLSSLRSGHCENDWLSVQSAPRATHRKLLDGSSLSKLAPLAISPDEQPATTTADDAPNPSTGRRPSVTTNPSASSLVISETGSLDRAKAAYERRKKTQIQDTDSAAVSGRVEITRVDPDDLIEELLKSTNLEQPDDSAETSGLQLFIAKDGTAALGNHEVKSQMSTGAQVFKQVVMDDR